MARLSLNEGSLLRRTVLHVAVFVLGTAAFLGLTSFLLVTILKGVLSPDKGTSADDSGEEAAATTLPTTTRPRPPRKKKGAAAVAPTPAPAAEEE